MKRKRRRRREKEEYGPGKEKEDENIRRVEEAAWSRDHLSFECSFSIIVISNMFWELVHLSHWDEIAVFACSKWKKSSIMVKLKRVMWCESS
ncbi:hypothetical protein LINPERPRIM_LOCUS22515, partial [Linum perenne]